MFDHPANDGHERVVFAQDAATGLQTIIAVHSTALGPAVGGCRLWRYDSVDAALTDALRLSRGMSYKNAMAELPLGGGKAVILLPQGGKTPQLMQAFGQAVNDLGGKYVTAEDVGATVADMHEVAKFTRYVSGVAQTAVIGDGNPSPQTALGVFLGLKAAVQFKLGKPSVDGLRIGVQGLGGVGMEVCRLLAAEGARLVVADLNPQAVARAVADFGAEACDSNAILFQRVDALAPCALGAVLNEHTIPRLQTKVIAGAANNQLATHQDAARLQAADILYAPDYVINAGGIISAGREYLGNTSAAEIQAQIARIPARLIDIFTRSADTGQPTGDIADALAREKLASARSGDQ